MFPSVIDAPEECSFLYLSFDTLSAKLVRPTLLMILATNRKTPEIWHHFSSLGGHKGLSEQISASDIPREIKVLSRPERGLWLSVETKTALISHVQGSV